MSFLQESVMSWNTHWIALDNGNGSMKYVITKTLIEDIQIDPNQSLLVAQYGLRNLQI